jgi:hypothetical protein
MYHPFLKEEILIEATPHLDFQVIQDILYNDSIHGTLTEEKAQHS